MLRVLGRRTSNNVQKVLWLLDELGADYEQEDYGGPFGKTQTPEYLKLNPNATVPTLIDGGMVLWESNAIIRYLAAKYGSAFYPADPAGRAHAEMWMDWQLGVLAPAFRPLFIALVREKRKLDELGTMHQAAQKLFGILDDALAERNYIAADTLTLADIAIGPMVHRWFVLGMADERTVHLKRLVEQLSSRRAFEKNIMIALA